MLDFIKDYIAIIFNLSLLLIIGGFYLFDQFNKNIDSIVCPKCNNWHTPEKISENQLGIFRKGHPTYSFRLDPRLSEVKMVWYEKSEIQYRCKNCGHEWLFTKVRRL